MTGDHYKRKIEQTIRRINILEEKLTYYEEMYEKTKLKIKSINNKR